VLLRGSWSGPCRQPLLLSLLALAADAFAQGRGEVAQQTGCFRKGAMYLSNRPGAVGDQMLVEGAKQPFG
jgi:hypothetical protein